MKNDLSDNIASQYDINGLLQALRDELQPMTDKALSKPLNEQDSLLLATEFKRTAPAIDSLLSCLTRLTNKQLQDLLKGDE